MALHNEAYDFSMFEPKRREREASQTSKKNIIVLPEKELQKNSRPKLHPFKMLSRFFCLALILGALGTLVYGQVRLTELTEEINVASQTLAEGQSLHTQLQMKTNAQLSLDDVEEYARNTLGMRPAEQGQVEYIVLSEGDAGEVLISGQEENVFSAIWHWLEDLLS